MSDRQEKNGNTCRQMVIRITTRCSETSSTEILIPLCTIQTFFKASCANTYLCGILQPFFADQKGRCTQSYVRFERGFYSF